MPKKKGGKKGKKGKGKDKKPIIEQYTTAAILDARTKMLCPRLGDQYEKSSNAHMILDGVVEKLIQKVAKKRLTELKLNGLRMNAVPDMSLILPELQTLEDINLSKNNLFNVVQVFSFLSQLTKIKKINLSDNSLNGSLPECAVAMTELEELNLDRNQITDLGINIVDKWQNLKILQLNDNALQRIPAEAKEWKNLEVLNLKSNQLAEISDDLLGAWKKLKKLYLGSNHIKTVPDTLGDCADLIELDLSSNEIEELPKSLSQCYELELLHVGNNKLLDFSADVFINLKKLRELQLYKNKIQVVPPEVGNLKCIKRLSFASNQIKGLPEEIGSCTTLEELYVSNNPKFSYIPPSSGHLRSLQALSAYKCPALKQVPTTLLEMSSLRELDLRAVKKNVCKITPECMDSFKAQKCVVRGGVVKKIKADLKPPPGMGGKPPEDTEGEGAPTV